MRKSQLSVFFPLLLFLSGCGVKYYERSADKEVGRIIEQKTEKIRDDKVLLSYTSGDATDVETVVMTLHDCLISAAKNNRDYRTRKENVYLSVLDLTSQRYAYGNKYGLTGSITREGDGTSDLNGSLNFSLLRILATGAQVSLNIAENFLQYFTGTRTKTFQSLVDLNVLQPLFRGAGREIALEGLVQSERDAVYAIRDFLRYQKSFSVDASSKFFNLLLLKNNTENYLLNYENLKEIRERITMLSDAGRIPAFQVDQARQDEYTAYQRWLSALNDYQSALDDFKIFLGFPPGANIVLEEKGLEMLIGQGVPEFTVDNGEMLTYAETHRLDLLNEYDRTADSERKVKVAADNLRTQLDFAADIQSQSADTLNPVFELKRPSYSAGFVFDLPVNRLPERNSYKQTLIQLDRQKRTFDLKRDGIAIEVRSASRNLEEARQSYLIQKTSISLAERRVESTNLLLQAGRATTRDLLDAQESVLSSRNLLASSVVQYLTSYLNFLLSAERIELDENGVWRGDLYEKINGENL